jgi:hypothetical protein
MRDSNHRARNLLELVQLTFVNREIDSEADGVVDHGSIPPYYVLARRMIVQCGRLSEWC